MSHEIELDAQQIKQQLKDYIKGKPQFSDYNFEGSNMSALLDVLSYNTYLNNLYLNMAVNEMFIDTAQTEDAIRSHSKELNYLPRSRRSARADVELTVTVNDDAGFVSVPKGTSFTTSANNQSFTFTTDRNVVISIDPTSRAGSANLSIFEGGYKAEFFTVDAANTNQRYLIQDDRIDTDSLVVTVRTSAADSTNGVYTYASDLFGLTGTSNVFFLQAGNEGRYEIVFGNDVTGRAVADGNVIEASYRISSGEDSNGARTFTIGSVGGYSNTSVALVNANTFARGGSLRETLESIRFNAVRHYQTLQRAVTANDYESLIIAEFPEIEALSVYGGEDQDPPKFGRVIISADVRDADGTSELLKEQITEFVNTKSPVSIEAEFVDPEFLEVDIKVTVRYNINLTTQSPTDIRSKVRSAINNFNTENLQDFNKTLRYSRLLATIDASDPSIIGNSTTIKAIRTISPIIGVSDSYSVSYANSLVPFNVGARTNNDLSSYTPAIRSAAFTIGSSVCYLEDDGTGNVDIINFDNNERNIIQAGVGSVAYTSGLLNLANFQVDGYTGQGIKIYGNVSDTTIRSSKNLILQISDDDIAVTALQERE